MQVWHKKRKPALFCKQNLGLKNEIITKVIVDFHLSLVFSFFFLSLFLTPSLLLSLTLFKFNARKPQGAVEQQTWNSHRVSVAFAKGCNSCSKHIVPLKTNPQQWRLNTPEFSQLDDRWKDYLLFIRYLWVTAISDPHWLYDLYLPPQKCFLCWCSKESSYLFGVYILLVIDWSYNYQSLAFMCHQDIKIKCWSFLKTDFWGELKIFLLWK